MVGAERDQLMMLIGKQHLIIQQLLDEATISNDDQVAQNISKAIVESLRLQSEEVMHELNSWIRSNPH